MAFGVAAHGAGPPRVYAGDARRRGAEIIPWLTPCCKRAALSSVHRDRSRLGGAIHSADSVSRRTPKAPPWRAAEGDSPRHLAALSAETAQCKMRSGKPWNTSRKAYFLPPARPICCLACALGGRKMRAAGRAK